MGIGHTALLVFPMGWSWAFWLVHALREDRVEQRTLLTLSGKANLGNHWTVTLETELGATVFSTDVVAGDTLDSIAASRFASEGARRPLRIPVTNTAVDGGFDEHGAFARVAFDLPRGAYATIVLREIMKNENADRGGIGDGILTGLPGHFRSRRDGKHRLRGQHVIQAGGQIVTRGRFESAGLRGVHFDASVEKHFFKFHRAQVEHMRRVSRHALGDEIGATARVARHAEPPSSFAHR